MLFKKYMTMIIDVPDEPLHCGLQPLSTLNGSIIMKSMELKSTELGFCPWLLHLVVSQPRASNSTFTL